MKRGSGKKKASPKKESPTRIDLSAGKGNDPKQDVLNRFLAETQKIKDNHESHQQEAQKRFEDLERKLKDQNQQLEEGADQATLMAQIKAHRANLAQFAKDSAGEKQGMREELANLEDELRRMRDQLNEVEIENQSYKQLADVEKQLREARGSAELEAARFVNKDLKDQVDRLKKDVEEGDSH